MITYKIYFIRHGLTEGNEEGRYIGSTDLPLSKEGEKDLIELKEAFEYPDVQKVYTSPLQRCLDTAEILYPDRLIHIVNNLREYDFGAFEGKSLDELKDSDAFKKWAQSGMKSVPEGAEDMSAFIKRCEEGIEEVINDMMKNKVHTASVITHGGVITNLLSMYGYPKREPLYWSVESGHGYTALLTTQLWQRDKVFEVFDPLPYNDDFNDDMGYEIFDLEESE